MAVYSVRSRRLAALVGPLLGLLVAVSLSFWLSSAPQGAPEVEYWGHYVVVAPGLGFVVNHDSYGFLEMAQQPQRLLLPQEVRQSRPLYALLGAAVGYPLTAGLHLAGRVGLAPRWPPADLRFYGFYSGYVLLNMLVLLGSLLLLRVVFQYFTKAKGEGWQFYALAWVLVANPITKAFFWTAHQQMLAFFVPLACLVLAVRASRATPGWGRLLALSCGLGLLPLAYGSFVLTWPALAFGWWRAAATAPRERRWWGLAGRLAVSAGLFALPTLLWIALLRAVGTTYYNPEAAHYHQFVWLLDAVRLPPREAFSLVGSKLAEYGASLQLLRGWLLLGAGLYGATWWRQRGRGAVLPHPAAQALGWVFATFVIFFALLGYYPERLAYTLLPLVLALLAGLLPHWPRRYARPVALAGAAGWHLYVLLSYGPFS